jgi:membrane protease YdiL (CAAX protease family)
MDTDLPPESPSPPAPAPEPDIVAAAARPWGFWATIGWSVLIGVGYVAAQTVAVLIYILVDVRLGGLRHLDVQALVSNGKVVGLSILASAPVVIASCVGAAYLRKGISFKEYFALHWPSPRIILRWLAVFFVYLLAVDFLLMSLKGEATEKFMTDVLKSAGWMMPILLFAIAVGAPISEEFFFRGFLFAGLKNSWLRAPGAIAVTALLFASIHLQYDLQGVIFVLMAGIFFGVARWKTNSLWVPILLHSFMNIVATIGQALPSK